MTAIWWLSNDKQIVVTATLAVNHNYVRDSYNKNEGKNEAVIIIWFD